MPIIILLKKLKQKYWLQVRGQFDLHSELQDTLYFRIRIRGGERRKIESDQPGP